MFNNAEDIEVMECLSRTFEVRTVPLQVPFFGPEVSVCFYYYYYFKVRIPKESPYLRLLIIKFKNIFELFRIHNHQIQRRVISHRGRENLKKKVNHVTRYPILCCFLYIFVSIVYLCFLKGSSISIVLLHTPINEQRVSSQETVTGKHYKIIWFYQPS